MRIIQITDLHIGKEHEFPQDVDVRGNFLKILDDVAHVKADLITLTGDLCFMHGSMQVYQWIRDRLVEYLGNAPVSLIPGNHDSSVLLSRVFQMGEHLKGEELYFTRTIEQQQLIFLDTGKGSASTDQKGWLRKMLSQSTTRNAIIFMHHPPVIGQVPHMDMKYALRDMSELQGLFREFPDRQFNIFTGHYHVEKTILQDNLRVFITPSCFVQIGQESATFQPDHYNIGYRVIDIDSHDNVRTYVRYL